MADEDTPNPDNVHLFPGAENPVAFMRAYRLDRIPPPRLMLTQEIPEKTVVLIAGEAGASKTYACLEIAIALSLGQAEFGRDGKRESVKVLYVDAENGEDLITMRVQALLRARGLSVGALEDRLKVLDGSGIDLTDDTDFGRLAREIDLFSPRLVFLDSVMALMTKDYYSNVEVRHFIDHRVRLLTKLRSRPTIALQHHLRKQTGDKELDRGAQAIMGAKAWSDAVDEALLIRSVGDTKCLVSHIKGRTFGKRRSFVLSLDLPPIGTQISEMRSTISDIGPPEQSGLDKSQVAEITVLEIIRELGPQAATTLDLETSKRAKCKPITAKRARLKLAHEGLIMQSGRKAPYCLVEDEEDTKAPSPSIR